MSARQTDSNSNRRSTSTNPHPANLRAYASFVPAAGEAAAQSPLELIRRMTTPDALRESEEWRSECVPVVLGGVLVRIFREPPPPPPEGRGGALRDRPTGTLQRA